MGFINNSAEKQQQEKQEKKLENYLGIKIDRNRDHIFSEHSQKLLKSFYMTPNEDTPQQALARAATAYCYGDYGLAQRIYDYASNNCFMFASPVLSNAPEIRWPVMGAGDATTFASQSHWLKNDWMVDNHLRGQPISCFLTYVPDSVSGLLSHTNEERWLSVNGGGVGGHWSHVRSMMAGIAGGKKGKAPGIMPFLHTVDADMVAYHQGSTRRGNYAAYLDISHPEIAEFMEMRLPTGDINRKNLNLHHGINLTDAFFDAVEAGVEWNFIDPKSQEVTGSVPARDLWERLLELRSRTGEPYLNNLDEANRRLPDALKARGLKINGSNLCNEIHLPTNEERSAVCCLSSVVLENFDEWKNTPMIQDLIRFLDNVLQFFIDTAPDVLERAKYSAFRERSLGLGSMGFHSLLQRKMIPWESPMAKSLNMRVFDHIRSEADISTKILAEERGEAPDMEGTGRRNAHLMAVAPNSNNAIIADTSPSIEPWKSPAFSQRTRAGTFLFKNKYLVPFIDRAYLDADTDLDYEEWTDRVWSQIITDGGVGGLDFLDDWTKDVFKPADEIDQHWVVTHAKDRQEFIDQGQSVNLFFPSGADKSYVASVHWYAFRPNEKGVALKGLYYYRTEEAAKGENVSKEVKRVVLKDFEEDCVACSG